MCVADTLIGAIEVLGDFDLVAGFVAETQTMARLRQRKWRESVLLREHFSDQRLPASALTVNLAKLGE